VAMRFVRSLRNRCVTSVADLGAAGFTADGGLFPVQTLRLLPALDAGQMYEQLLRRGVRTVQQGGKGRGAQISLIGTTRHRPDEIDLATEALVQASTGQTQSANSLRGKIELPKAAP
jgi:hypothetical protein